MSVLEVGEHQHVRAVVQRHVRQPFDLCSLFVDHDVVDFALHSDLLWRHFIGPGLRCPGREKRRERPTTREESFEGGLGSDHGVVFWC